MMEEKIKYIINDNRLNVIDKGLLLMIIYSNEPFISNIFRLKCKDISDAKYNSAIAKLIYCGYLTKTRKQGVVEWTINSTNSDTTNSECTNSECTNSTIEPYEDDDENDIELEVCDNIEEKIKLFLKSRYINLDKPELIVAINKQFKNDEVNYLFNYIHDNIKDIKLDTFQETALKWAKRDIMNNKELTL